MEGADTLPPEQVLARLADAYGNDVWDARGIHMQATPSAQRKLLKSMGVMTGTAADEVAALDVHRSVAGSALPPVVVVRQDGTRAMIENNAPYWVQRITWHIALDDGSERSETAGPSACVSPSPASLAATIVSAFPNRSRARPDRHLPPGDYPRLSFAVTGSHDLPILKVWWDGLDIAQKQVIGLYPDDDEAASQRRRRKQDRSALLEARRAQGLIHDGEPSTEDFTRAAHTFLARTEAALVVPQLDDIFGESTPVNVPGPVTEYPNWRRKYRLTLQDLSASDSE